nr:MAG TPA: hypothetical protein [Caudoviricetes sp.]
MLSMSSTRTSGSLLFLSPFCWFLFGSTRRL